jgi:ribosome-associated translation inhibitor RaiA
MNGGRPTMDSRKIEISSEAWEVVERKASAFGITESDVINWMVLEFSKSTPTEREVQRLHKRTAWIEYKKDNLSAAKKESNMVELIHKAWNKGWADGWIHFQVRKSTNPFKLEE